MAMCVCSATRCRNKWVAEPQPVWLPVDACDTYDTRIWAGVVPMRLATGEPAAPSHG